jgi:hypothetical protein
MTETHTLANTALLSNRLYDILKVISQLLIPASMIIYFLLAERFNWEHVIQVGGSLASIATLLGMLLHIAAKSYNSSNAKYDGAINIIEKPDGGLLYSLELESDIDDLAEKETILFKVLSGKQVLAE